MAIQYKESSEEAKPEALPSLVDKSTGKPIKIATAYAMMHGEKIEDYVNRLREGLKSWVTALVLPCTSGEWSIVIVTKEALIHVTTTFIKHVDSSGPSVFHAFELSPVVSMARSVTEQGKYLRSTNRYELASFMIMKGANVRTMPSGDIDFYDADGNTIFVMPKSTTNIIR